MFIFPKELLTVCVTSLCRGKSEDPDSTSWWQAGDAPLPIALDE